MATAAVAGVEVAPRTSKANGALDATFGTGGTVTTDFAGGEDRAEALVVQGGRLVAAGSTITASAGQRFALARYL
jgi:hypothetical protein